MKPFRDVNSFQTRSYIVTVAGNILVKTDVFLTSLHLFSGEKHHLIGRWHMEHP